VTVRSFTGSIILVSSVGYSAIGGLPTVSDNHGDAFTLIFSHDCFTPCTNHIIGVLYSATSSSSGPVTVTVTWGLLAFVNLSVGSYSYSTVSAIGQTFAFTVSGTHTESVTGTSGFGHLLVSSYQNIGGGGSGTITFPASQTQDTATNPGFGNQCGDLEHKFSAGGSQTMSVTHADNTNAGRWFFMVELF
jgi:hypothetical protein